MVNTEHPRVNVSKYIFQLPRQKFFHSEPSNSEWHHKVFNEKLS